MRGWREIFREGPRFWGGSLKISRQDPSFFKPPLSRNPNQSRRRLFMQGFATYFGEAPKFYLTLCSSDLYFPSMFSLEQKVQTFPKGSGVYLMKGIQGEVLYIGKANNLKNRVLSYFREQSKKERYQIGFLMRKVVDIDYVVTDNEKEALLLENTLIKKHSPRYNLILKDDKSFISLKINDSHSFPGLFITRQIAKDGSSYFGPYTSARALRETVDLLTRTFKLRTCSDREFANRSRPCLKFDIGRCSAPCVGKIDAKTYASHIESVRLFLKGKKQEFVEILKERMQRASDERLYEDAAGARDKIR